VQPQDESWLWQGSAPLSRLYQTPRLPLYYLPGGVRLLCLLGLAAVWLPALRAFLACHRRWRRAWVLRLASGDNGPW
jgi:hypothetical protein